MDKKVKITIAIFGALALLTQVVNVYVTNTNSLESVEATNLRAKVDELKEKNINLQSEVLSASSYITISSRAGDLGYRDTREFVSLYDPIELAQRR